MLILKRIILTCLASIMLASIACNSNLDVRKQENYESSSGSAYSQVLAMASGDVVEADSFEYLGAFRLPGDEERPRTFAYGGSAMTFNPNGDPNGDADGFPGSLFIMGHDRIAYGDLPNGNQVAEVSIPQPIPSRDMSTLNTAEFLQDFEDVLAGHFTNLEEIPRIGMAFLERPQTGAKIHFAWGQHLQEPGDASHGWFDPDLSASSVEGFWHMGDLDPYRTTGYIFEIPAEWADKHAGGRYLATGRMRDGGMSGMGPALIAYTPWLEDGSAPDNNSRLDALPLLLYESAYNTDAIERSLNGYQHPDEWEGAAWITTEDGRSAVLFAGTKSTGDKYWYGYIHPDGPQYVCVDDLVEDIDLMCRHADGSFCAASDLDGCCDEDAGTCASNRGWWSNRFDAQIILYDPDDLIGVAQGKLESWQPQPYAVLDIDEYLYLSAPEWDEVDLGWGDQRRNRIGEVAYDRQSGILYVLELYADEAKPIVHVWSIQ